MLEYLFNNQKVQMAYGCSRMVLLVGSVAIKLPNMRYRWPACLWGLIHNISERGWWKAASGAWDGEFTAIRPLLCPVLYADRFGFVCVMQRVEPLPREYDCPVLFTWLASRFEPYCICPAEKKRESFGILEGKIVAIDYA